MKHLILSLLLALPSLAVAQTAQVRTTYYNLRGRTASGVQTHKGICAVSPDLEKAGFKLGKYLTLIYKDGRRVKLLIADRTSKRLRNTVDIWSATRIPNEYCIAEVTK